MVFLIYLASLCFAADVPRVSNYQGKFTYSSGNSTGGFYFKYELYQTDVGGSPVWTQEPASDADSVWCEAGLFSDTLGLRIDTVFTKYSVLYLQVGIKDDWGDSWSALLPREQLLAAPWALTIADNAITQDKILWDFDASGEDDSVSAVDVPYDNTVSGFSATDVQNAIDEAEGRIDNIEGNYVELSPTSIQTDAGVNPSLYINRTTGAGNLIELQDGGTTRFTVGLDGTVNNDGNLTVGSGASEVEIDINSPLASSASIYFKSTGANRWRMKRAPSVDNEDFYLERYNAGWDIMFIGDYTTGNIGIANDLIVNGEGQMDNLFLVPSGSSPPADEGKMYYSSTDHTFYGQTDAGWIDLAASGGDNWGSGTWTVTDGIMPSTVSESDAVTFTGTGATSVSQAGRTVTISSTDNYMNGEAAGGDLATTYPSPTVAKIQGRDVYDTDPSSGQVLKWDGANSRWAADEDISGTQDLESVLSQGNLAGSYNINMNAQNILNIDSISGSGSSFYSWTQTSAADWDAGTYNNTHSQSPGDVALDCNKWFNTSWTKRKRIDITNTSGSDLTDFQVKLIVDYDADMNADFSDLRFTDPDSVTLIDYWIEEYGVSDTAAVWIEIPSIPTTGTSIFMYYGNAGASTASDGVNTFDFFDDFNDGDDAGWTEYNGTWNVVANEYYQSADLGTYMRTSNGESSWDDYVYDTKIKIASGGSTGGFAGVLFRFQDTDNHYAVILDDRPDDSFDIREWVTGSYNSFLEDASITIDRDVWYLLTVSVADEGTGNVTIKVYIDGDYKNEYTDSPQNWDSGAIALMMHGTQAYYDDIRVRKFADPEPGYSFGAEEQQTYELSGSHVSQVHDFGVAVNYTTFDYNVTLNSHGIQFVVEVSNIAPFVAIDNETFNASDGSHSQDISGLTPARYVRITDNFTSDASGTPLLHNYTVNANSGGVPVVVFTTGIDISSNVIANLSDPSNPQDAATKAYVDAAAVGDDWGTGTWTVTDGVTPSAVSENDAVTFTGAGATSVSQAGRTVTISSTDNYISGEAAGGELTGTYPNPAVVWDTLGAYADTSSVWDTLSAYPDTTVTNDILDSLGAYADTSSVWDTLTAYRDTTEHDFISLDNAYDESGAGAGRIATVDAGPIQLDASGNESRFRMVERAVPATPGDGDIEIFDTNLGPLAFYYDNARSKWLSLAVFTDGGGRNGNQAVGYLRMFNGLVASATVGHQLPDDACIVAVALSCNNSSTCTGLLRANGGDIAGTSVSLAAETQSNIADLDVNANYADIIAPYCSAGTMVLPQMQYWYRIRR